MYLSEMEREKIGKFIIAELKKAGISIKSENKVCELVFSIISQSMEDERSLEEDATKLFKIHKNTLGPGLDQDKAIRLIKEKLAKDRGFVL